MIPALFVLSDKPEPVMINRPNRTAGLYYDIVDTKDFQQEISQPKKEKAVYRAQSRMLNNFVSVARDSVDTKMIRAMLRFLLSTL